MHKTTKARLFLIALFVAGCASAQASRTAVQVPDQLKPGAHESLAMIASAKGVQIYECRARKDRPGDYEWAFVAPEADLFDARGNRIGRHYAGPHWEAKFQIYDRNEDHGRCGFWPWNISPAEGSRGMSFHRRSPARAG